MKLNIAVLPGDGIGPEVIEQSVRVCDAVAKIFNHTIKWNYGLVGASAIEKSTIDINKKFEDAGVLPVIESSMREISLDVCNLDDEECEACQ